MLERWEKLFPAIVTMMLQQRGYTWKIRATFFLGCPVQVIIIAVITASVEDMQSNGQRGRSEMTYVHVEGLIQSDRALSLEQKTAYMVET